MQQAFRREDILVKKEEEITLSRRWVADHSNQFVIHTAVDMDRGAEVVENLTLERSAKLRHHWLLFDSFKKVHVEAQLKTKHQVFDVVLSGAAGANLYEYADHHVYEPGEFIVTEGKRDDNLYLLQYGKVTAYTAQTEFVTEEERAAGKWNGIVKRLRTMRGSSGAVINDDNVYNNRTVCHSVVVDEKSVVWKIVKKNLKIMERDNPSLAVAIHRHISKFSLVCRDRLEREIVNLEIMERQTAEGAGAKNKTYFKKRHLLFGKKKGDNDDGSTPTTGKSNERSKETVLEDIKARQLQMKRNESEGLSEGHTSHSLAETISKRLQEAHWNWSHQGWDQQHLSEYQGRLIDEKEGTMDHDGTLAQLHDAQHHHGHRFHHINTALEIAEHNKKEDERILRERPWWLEVKPHVSSVMSENAKKSFDMWADDYMYDLEQEKERKASIKETTFVPPLRRSISETTDEELSRERESFSLKRGGSSIYTDASGGSKGLTRSGSSIRSGSGDKQSYTTEDLDAMKGISLKEANNGSIMSSGTVPAKVVTLIKSADGKVSLPGTIKPPNSPNRRATTAMGTR